MPRRTPERELKRLEEEGYRGRSATYRYVRENLTRFVKVGVGTKDGPSWEAFAALLAREGQRNKRGGPISWDSARRIFERASKDARAREAEMRTGVPHKVHPSRLPQTWQPPVVDPPPTPVPASPRPAVAPTPADGEARPSRSRTAADMLAGVRRQLDERSGRGER